MRTPVRNCLAALAVVAIAAVGLAACAWQPTIDAIAPPARGAFETASIARGAALAAIGNCAGCHTVDGGVPYAGGVALATPFGTIFGSNLTPDADTGIGRWSDAAFARAMRRGIDRDGRHLYPAFPYDHFTRANDDDLRALYAYLMTRDAASMVPPANDLAWPLRWRALVAGWNALYLHEPASRPATFATSTARGAYLVDGLGHCGACHTPRNALGAEEGDRAFAGAVVDGWYAPPLDARSPSPIPWTVDALATYLRTGLADEHAMAGGPMQGVVESLADADEADVRAIAERVVAMLGPTTPARSRLAEAARARARGPLAAADAANDTASDAAHDDATLRLGATVYATACARCHDAGRELGSGGALQLPLAIALYDDDPRSLLRIVRDGIRPNGNRTGRWMPAFGTTLDDTQLAALAAWLRRTGADRPPWPDLAKAVADTARRP